MYVKVKTLLGEPAAKSVEFYIKRTGMPQGRFNFEGNVTKDTALKFADAVARVIEQINDEE
jgi:hypothetical protein